MNKQTWLRAEAWMALTQAWILLYLVGPPPLLHTLLALVGTSLLPAFNLGLLLSSGRWAVALAYGLCLSPLAAAATGVASCALHLDSELSVLIPALLTMPLAGLAVLKSHPEKDKRDPGLLLALGGGAALGVVTGALLLSSVVLRLSMHGLLHASIVYRILDAGMPPENPFFAGEPLIYYWVYHLAAGGVSSVTALSPLFSFAILNILAAAGLVPCLYLIGRTVGLKPGCALLGSAIGTLALNPLGPLFLVLQEPYVSFGDIERGMFPGYLVRFMAFGFDLRLASPLTKFWNVSSFPSSIVLFLLGLRSGIDSTRISWRSFATLSISAAVLLLINPLTGFCFFVSMGVASLAWACKDSRPRFFMNLGALALAGAACIPYLVSIASKSSGGSLVGFSFNVVHLMGVLLAAGPVLLFAAFGVKDIHLKGGRAGIGLSLFCLCLLLMALCLRFPEGNEYKIIRLLVFPAGIMAATPALRFLKRLRLPVPVLVALAALLLLPNSILALAAYFTVLKADLPMMDRDLQILRSVPGDELREAYRILREETPPNSVVVVNPVDHEQAIGGKFQGDEVPSLARRAIYTGHRFYLTERADGFQDRLERTESLFNSGDSGDGPLPEPVKGRPLYILVRNKTVPPVLESSRFEEVYRGKTCALFLLKSGEPR